MQANQPRSRESHPPHLVPLQVDYSALSLPHSTRFAGMGGELIFYILFLSLSLGVLSWFLTPKGDNRTSVPPSSSPFPAHDPPA